MSAVDILPLLSHLSVELVHLASPPGLLRISSLTCVRLSSGVGHGPQCPLLLAAQEDRGPRRRLACPAAGGLDGGLVARAVHELAGVLQRRGAGGSPAGPLPASRLPPQWLPCTRHGSRPA